MTAIEGPWHVGEKQRLIFGDESEFEAITIESGAQEVALVHADEYTARLIAAAPELLLLVIDAVEDESEFETEWNKAAREIIKKAT